MCKIKIIVDKMLDYEESNNEKCDNDMEECYFTPCSSSWPFPSSCELSWPSWHRIL